MKYSSLVDRIAGESTDAWKVHYEGLARLNAGEDIIVLSIGQETGERTPELIVDAAIESLRRGRHHYTLVNGERELRAAIAARHTQRTGQSVDESQCNVFSGAQNALFAASQCLLEAGDEVILVEPYYTTYPATFSAGGARLVSVPAAADSGFQPDPEAVAAAITPRTRVIVLNSPNNPTGVICERDRVEALVRLCVENKIWLVSDEVYAELAFPDEHFSPASAKGADEVCVTVSSLSKSHRMTGWRLGWVIGPRALARHLSHLSLCMCYGLPAFIQDAAVAALQHGDDIAGIVRASLTKHAEVMLAGLKDISGIKIYSAAGGMFIVLDVRALKVPGEQFAQGFLDQHDVSVLPCDGFGASGAGLLRISLCETDERLREACRRLREYVTKEGWRQSG